MKMGVGGLLKEIDTRPLPREKAPATPRTGVGPAQRADHRSRSFWPPVGRAGWRRTTSCWSPTAPASR